MAQVQIPEKLQEAVRILQESLGGNPIGDVLISLLEGQMTDPMTLMPGMIGGPFTKNLSKMEMIKKARLGRLLELIKNERSAGGLGRTGIPGVLEQQVPNLPFTSEAIPLQQRLNMQSLYPESRAIRNNPFAQEQNAMTIEELIDSLRQTSRARDPLFQR